MSSIPVKPEATPGVVASLVRSGLDALPDLLRRHGVLLLALFGSTARGERRARSDLDFAVLFQGPPADETWLTEEAELAWELEELLRPTCPLDLVVLNRASAPLQRSVSREGIPLFEDRPGRWLAFRIQARKQYEDTEKHRRRRWDAVVKRYGPAATLE